MPNPTSSPTADVEQIYLPKFGGLVTVNVADVPYLRATQGALSPAEYAAQQAAVQAAEQAAEQAAAAATTAAPTKGGKPFKSKAEKGGEQAPDGDAGSDTGSGDAGSSATTP